MFTDHHEVHVRGVATHVAEAGSGPPIVLLHGNPDTHAVWEPVVAALAPRHRCIAPDLPGFGGSHAPARFDVSLANQAAWVNGVLDALSLDRVHLVVHDIGGVYGLAFATEHAARIASLTITNTVFFADYHWHFWARVWRTPGLGELSMALMGASLFARKLRRGSPPKPTPNAHWDYTFANPETRRMVLRWYRAMNVDLYRSWEPRMLAATASVPRQVLWGDRDEYIPAQFATRFGAPSVQRMPDAGHWLMLQHPARVADAIASLVATSSP
ncbi:MAG TPA: alpha/beta fold hydrolase [Kofleriaceae bacterium]|nr:alpha/beta fold hydrolase [Kofleriaceae bacterium]